MQKVLTECVGCALLGRDPRTSSIDSLKQRRNHHLQFEFVLEGQAEWSCQCLAKSLQIWSAVTFTFLHHREMQALLKDNLSPSRDLILKKKKKKRMEEDREQVAVESGCSQRLGRGTFTKTHLGGGKGLEELIVCIFPVFLPLCQLCFLFLLIL